MCGHRTIDYSRVRRRRLYALKTYLSAGRTSKSQATCACSIQQEALLANMDLRPTNPRVTDSLNCTPAHGSPECLQNLRHSTLKRPAATSHSFLGVKVKVTSASLVETRASL